MMNGNPRALWVFLIAVLCLFGGLPFAKGALYIAQHEGDTLHLADIVFREAQGQWPHLDFMTPIGLLATAPITLFIWAGLGFGYSFFAAQFLVGLILVPALYYVIRSRIPGWAGWIYGAFTLMLCVALVHGEPDSSLSVSMHYNRWAWAVTYVIVPIILLAPQGQPRPVTDGMIVGLGLAMLTLTKVTYFASLAPAVLVALILRRSGRTMLVALVAGLAVAALVTFLAGVGFWSAYLQDLLAVARSEVRSQPSESLSMVITSPETVGASLTLILSTIFLRQAGRMSEGLIMLILSPGLVYIVFQNWGNDPQWLLMLAVLIWVLRPVSGVQNEQGIDLRQALTFTAIVAGAFAFPSASNVAFSPIRHLARDTAKTMEIFTHGLDGSDTLSGIPHLMGVVETRLDDEDAGLFASYIAMVERKPLATLNGEPLPYCEQQTGIRAWFETVAKDLEDAGYAGKKIMTTDLFSSFFLYGDFQPVPRAAPWNYGGLDGIDQADFIVVPLCAGTYEIRTSVLKALADAKYKLTEVRRTPLYVLITASKAP